MSKIILDIQNLHCNGCKNLIERNCMEIEGVKTCEVSLENNIATIDTDGADTDLILAKINSLGRYVAKIKSLE